MNFIVAVDKNWAIGNKGQLLYSLKQDMKYFKETTLNKVVVMGDVTFYSFPKKQALPNRTNIVLTFDKNFNEPNTIPVHNLDELFEELKKYNSEDIFVIGGAGVYNQLIPYCKKGYITKINAEKEADRFLPNLDNDKKWKVTSKSKTQNENDLDFNFCIYENEEPEIHSL